MTKKTFLKGAAIIGVAGLIVQIMGAFFRIPLANIIGEEGMGYFQTAYPIYIFLLVFSTNGAPAAISKMTSERLALGQYEEAHRVFKYSFVVMLVFGAIAFSAIFFFAREIVAYVGGKPEAYYSMISIAPALLFVPIMSVFRGYFQGMQNMLPTAISQIVEQAVRVIVGLALAVMLVPYGIEIAAAGGTIGTSIGPIAGVLVLVIIYFTKRKKIVEDIQLNPPKQHYKEKAGSIIKTLAVISIPITIGVSILPIMNIVDVGITMARMQVGGISMDQANDLYGIMSGFAAPIINIPMALALSIALSMVPAVASAKASEDHAFLEVNVRMGLRTAMIIGVPCSFGLIALAEPIMLLLYPAQAESASDGAMCLMILATGVIFLSIAQTMAGILQGLGKPSLAVVSLAIGVAVKFVLTYILAAIPSLNIEGAAIGSAAGYAVIGIISLVFVKRMTSIRFDMKLSVLKPLAAGIVLVIVVLIIYSITLPFIGNSLAAVLSIGVGAIVYVITILKIKAILINEIKLMPKGERIASILEKLKLA